jgi:hypothetical protein
VALGAANWRSLKVTEKVQSAVGNITGVSAVGDTATINATMRVNLAVQHLLAAARFSRDVGRLESEHKGQQFGEFWESIFHPAMACILTTVASLEAYANELFSDRNTVFPEYSPELIHNLWETYEQKPILEKFQFALLLLRKPTMDRGAGSCQDIKVLIGLRNALTHFKPEWMNEADEHAKISAKLASKIEGSSFLPTSELLFPRRWAGHSCTSWAVNSAIAFAKDFERSAGLPAKYVFGDETALNP